LVHCNPTSGVRLADATLWLQFVQGTRKSNRSQPHLQFRHGVIDHKAFYGPLSYYIRVLSHTVPISIPGALVGRSWQLQFQQQVNPGPLPQGIYLQLNSSSHLQYHTLDNMRSTATALCGRRMCGSSSCSWGRAVLPAMEQRAVYSAPVLRAIQQQPIPGGGE
jgi:hypothetical protein